MPSRESRTLVVKFLARTLVKGESFAGDVFVTDFLIGQHLVGHPINSHLNCAQLLIVIQPTEVISQPKLF